jgi:outer membrane autotransporter protein
MWYGKASLAHQKRYGSLMVAPKVGVLYMNSSIDGYIEQGGAGDFANDTSNNLGRLEVGGRVTLLSMEKVKPFLLGYYEYDFKSPAVGVGQGDDDGFKVGLGAGFAFSETISGVLEANKVLARGNYSSHTLKGSIRIPF